MTKLFSVGNLLIAVLLPEAMASSHYFYPFNPTKPDKNQPFTKVSEVLAELNASKIAYLTGPIQQRSSASLEKFEVSFGLLPNGEIIGVIHLSESKSWARANDELSEAERLIVMKNVNFEIEKNPSYTDDLQASFTWTDRKTGQSLSVNFGDCHHTHLNNTRHIPQNEFYNPAFNYGAQFDATLTFKSALYDAEISGKDGLPLIEWSDGKRDTLSARLLTLPKYRESRKIPTRLPKKPSEKRPKPRRVVR